MRRPMWVLGLFWASLTSTVLVSGLARGQAPSRRPEVWAIVVGVGDYTHSAIPDRRAPARDANRIHQWIKQAGWDDGHRILLSDSGNSDPGEPDTPALNILPTRRNLDWAFRSWLFTRKIQPGDTVVFYFAGESRTVVKPQGEHLDPRVEHYLLPMEAVDDNPEQTGWSIDQAVDECARRRLQVVCWLATAPDDRRGALIPAPPRNPPPARPRPNPGSGVNWLVRLARWPGVTAWLAADRPRRLVLGGDPGETFTRALLEALGKPGAEPGRKPKVKPNLASCLRDLQADHRLRLQGFASMGGVPPSMTLWPMEKDIAEPRPELIIQAGHADKVTALAFPADGRLILTASQDSTVRVWSAPDRSLLQVLTGQAVGVSSMLLSRDDRWLVSGGNRGTVFVYDRENNFTPKRLGSRQPHNVRISQIVRLPDGIRFFTVDSDGQSFLWDPSESPLSPVPWMRDAICQEIVCGGRSGRDGPDTGAIIARFGDGTVRAFDSSGGGGTVLDFGRAHPRALAVSPDGVRLAVGFDDGLIIVRDLKSPLPSPTEHRVAVGPSAVHRLVFSPAGHLAVGHENGARILSPGISKGGFDLVKQPVQELAFSPGGEYLTACTQEVGELWTWRIDGDKDPKVVLDDREAHASVVGFTGNARGLVFGDIDGGLAFRPLDPQGGEVPWNFPANRGKLQQLSASPSRRVLMFLDEQRNVRLWDLKDRTCRRVRGTWSAGVVLDDDRLVLVPDSNSADLSGRLLRVDRNTLDVDRAFFARAAGSFKIPEGITFERIVLSPDGKRIAAASDASKVPMVCVWEAESGRLTHWISSDRLEVDAVAALAFSNDARYLLTGGDAPVARLWDLSADQGELKVPAASFSDPKITRNLTCAAIRPGNAGPSLQIVTGHSNGEVHVWKWADGKVTLEMPQLVARYFATTVKALCFTTDGRYLAAAGDGTRIWLGIMDPQPQSIDILDRLRPHHSEQINALTTWRDRPILISGSDDTTIRFWDLKNATLWGTFSAAGTPAVDAAPIQELDWAFYTPDGFFDASAAATKLAHYRRPDSRPARDRDRASQKSPAVFGVAFRHRDEPQQLEQFAESHNIFGLGEQLLLGKHPGSKPTPDAPLPVSISMPPRTDPTLSQARLTVTLGAADFQSVRLYHNDVPIPTIWNANGPRPMSFDVTVTLAPNRNQFYVMASRENVYDSCSKVVEVDYQAPMEPGQIHILALGVGGYERRRLKYPQRDAEQLGQLLYRRGVDKQGNRGLSFLLPDAEVTRKSVQDAFDRIARHVEDRPQDTVVVFLAGHTGIFDSQRFCLLLPTFPFPKDEPILVAARGVAPEVEEGVKLDTKDILPYSLLEANLSRLNALNRLVIVDACQAGAIFEDPKVRAIQKMMELSSRRARTSYLMAARRGEPAMEVDPLKHGLFTYTLLRGMGAIPMEKERQEVAKLGLPRDADFNKDRIVSTSELDAYAKQVLPQLSKVFPAIVDNARAAPEQAGAPARGPATKDLEQATRMQSIEGSFPLVPIVD